MRIFEYHEGNIREIAEIPHLKHGLRVGYRPGNVASLFDNPHRSVDGALLSAAPEMQAALEAMQNALEEVMREMSGKGPAANWGIINDASCAAMRALKKSKGEGK